MKATTTKKILIGAVAALCVTAIAGTTALAAYMLRDDLNGQNSITVGQTVDTVVLGDGILGAYDEGAEMYPGDSITVTYNVQIEDHTGDVTVSWSLMAGETDVEANDDFDVVVTTGAENTAVTEDTTPVVNGNLVFTITMNGSETISSEAELPDYSEVVLSVTLAA